MIRAAIIALLLSACSTWQPRDVHYTAIQWQTPCNAGDEIRLVRVVDTQFPLLDCIRYSSPGAAAELTLIALAGFPPMACALAIDGGETEVFTSLQYFGDKISDQVLQHELEHAFGMEHPQLLPFAHSCAAKEATQ